MSTLTLGQRAIGQRDGDYLKIENQFARVLIEFSDGVYYCHGDLKDLRAQNKEFSTMGAAISYAMQSLALFQEGRTS